MLKDILRHPLTKDLLLDDPETTFLRKDVISQKPFLRRIYQEWYEWAASRLPEGIDPVLELGSGAGFLDEYIPKLITSEVFFCPFAQIVINGCYMPFKQRSLKAIVMVNVLHHIPDVYSFFQEALRCLRPGGKILMVEPWITPWSKFIYNHVHHEPIDMRTQDWRFPRTGPLSGANSALPWIIFERDRHLFESEYSMLRIVRLSIEKPFVYLISGGLSYRPFMPGLLYSLWAKLESALDPWCDKLGMFARIELQRV